MLEISTFYHLRISIEDFAAKKSLLAKRATFQINLPNILQLGYLAQLGTMALKFSGPIILRLAHGKHHTSLDK